MNNSVKKQPVMKYADEMYEKLLGKQFISSDMTDNNIAKLKHRLYIDGLITNYDFHYDKTFREEINFETDEFEMLKKFIIS